MYSNYWHSLFTKELFAKAKQLKRPFSYYAFPVYLKIEIGVQNVLFVNLSVAKPLNTLGSAYMTRD